MKYRIAVYYQVNISVFNVNHSYSRDVIAYKHWSPLYLLIGRICTKISQYTLKQTSLKAREVRRLEGIREIIWERQISFPAQNDR